MYLSRLVGNTAYAAPVYKTKRPSPEGQAVRFFPEKTLLLSIKAAHDDFPAHGENARYTHSFSFVQFSCPNAARLTSPVHDLPSRSLRPNGCCSPRLRRFGHFLAFTVPFAEGITQFLLNCRLTNDLWSLQRTATRLLRILFTSCRPAANVVSIHRAPPLVNDFHQKLPRLYRPHKNRARPEPDTE